MKILIEMRDMAIVWSSDKCQSKKNDVINSCAELLTAESTLSMANMKTCCSQSATLTTLERWQRRGPPSHLPLSEVTSGAGKMSEAPMRSAKHKCCIKMKCVERSLMEL